MPKVDKKWIRCKADKRAIREGCCFDESAGLRVVRFIETFCRHSKGKFAGKPFVLDDWERDFLMRLFGWRRSDGRRRFVSFR